MIRILQLGLVILALAFHFIPATVASNSIVVARPTRSVSGPVSVKSTT